MRNFELAIAVVQCVFFFLLFCSIFAWSACEYIVDDMSKVKTLLNNERSNLVIWSHVLFGCLVGVCSFPCNFFPFGCEHMYNDNSFIFILNKRFGTYKTRRRKRMSALPCVCSQLSHNDSTLGPYFLASVNNNNNKTSYRHNEQFQQVVCIQCDRMLGTFIVNFLCWFLYWAAFVLS